MLSPRRGLFVSEPSANNSRCVMALFASAPINRDGRRSMTSPMTACPNIEMARAFDSLSPPINKRKNL
jgi:hypothetical protein